MNVTDATFAGSVADWDALPPGDLPEAVFVGRSNVGKSTLLNALARQEGLAYTSGTPGRTRTLNFFHIERGRGGPFRLVDAPGLGYAKAPAQERECWQRLLARYLAERAPLRLVMHLMDSRHEPQPADRDVFHFLGGQRVPYLAVLTKADKLNQSERATTARRAKEVLLEAQLEAPVVLTSASEGEGLTEVRAWLDEMVR